MTVSASSARRLAVPVAALAGLLILAGCGRKADPELPRATAPAEEMRPVGIPIGPSAPAPQPVKSEKRSLPLDVLL
ncbi:MAG: lipoprotein [Hyphomicrobiales bacterium]|nr:lipoprotein [Hyphomicrobiales bacterium]